MKVCTDACLFGAWISKKIQNPKAKIRNVLDIGTGTGLLALMYAQKNPNAIIDAVEIDEAAALQTRENFENSPWKERLTVYNTSIQQFNNLSAQPTKYDLIISNPPFFKNDLRSDNDKRNLALHGSELGLEELLNEINKNLKQDGNFAVLLAYRSMDQFMNLASRNSFYCAEKILIKQTPEHNYFRSILLCTREEVSTKHSEIMIQDKEKKYTEKFVELLEDYYLYL